MQQSSFGNAEQASYYFATYLEALNIPMDPPFDAGVVYSNFAPAAVPPASSLGLYEETPTSVDFQLPTPDPDVGADVRRNDFDVFLEGSGLFDDPVIPEDPAGEPPLPPAPVLKDLDSFSDGTGLGSFDYSLTSDHGIADRRPTSLAFSPAHPEESVVLWRNDVHRCTVTGTAAELEREGLPEEHPEEPATKRRRLSKDSYLDIAPLRTAPPHERFIALPFASAQPSTAGSSVSQSHQHLQQWNTRSAPSFSTGRVTDVVDIPRPSSAPPSL